MAKTSSKTTTDHEEIRRWAEDREGKPATVAGTESGDEPGILRIDFPPYENQGKLEDISWDDWFKKFDESNLAFLYEDESARGETSYFNKLISRENAEQSSGKKKPAGSANGRSASSREGSTTARSASRRPADNKRSQSSGRGAAGTRSSSNTENQTSARSSSSRAKKASGRSAAAKKSVSARGRTSSTGRSKTKNASTTSRGRSTKAGRTGRTGNSQAGRSGGNRAA